MSDRRQHRMLIATLCVMGAAVAASAQEFEREAIEFFERNVRPVLVERCHECHSLQAKKLKADLLLDSRAGVLKGGETGPAIVVGDPDASRLIEAVRYDNPDLQMPPKAKLDDKQIADLAAWVKMGAPWPDDVKLDAPANAEDEAFDVRQRKAEHWAWKPLDAMPPPRVADADWPTNPIDKFILSELEDAGLKPAPPADPASLIRRVHFDLIGLPPSPRDVSEFVLDPSDERYEAIVDRLLASPAFGERWARHWLDLMRYAESRGHEGDDSAPLAWRYRDYVIRAINADVPYHQFVAEHIAGDIMPHPRHDPSGAVNESLLATGFWYLGAWVHSPVDIREDEALRVDNQIDVMSKAFLGLTVACARCHDHKFDAITTKDYYALAGFLQSSSYREAQFEHLEHNARIAANIASLDETMRPMVQHAFVEAIRPGLQRTGDYLSAAAEAVRSGPAEALVDSGGDGAADDPAAGLVRRVSLIAAERGLDEARLSRWIDQLSAALTDPAAPLHAIAVVAHDAQLDEPDRVTILVLDLLRKAVTNLKEAVAAAGAGQTLIDFAYPRSYRWYAEGQSFGDAPAPAGLALLGTDAAQPIRAILDRHAAHSGLRSDKLGGMVRTHTFEITAPKMFHQIAGSGQVWVVVDSHRLIRGPLHGELKVNVEHGDEYKWIEQDLSAYIGHRAHIEYSASGPSNYIAVSRVVEGEAAPADGGMSNELILGMLSAQLPDTVDDLAASYQQLFADVADSLAENKLIGADDAAARASLADWLARHADLFGYERADRSAVEELMQPYAKLRASLADEIRPSARAMAIMDGNGEDEYVFIRGNYRNQGPFVPRRFLEAIGGPEPMPILAGSGRWELTQRLIHPANPLTPRVAVNRLWHHLFGRGIVASIDNFGVLGEKPTHPELLDWLASRFIRDDWSIKRMIRMMATSSTYRMASRPDDQLAEQKDPNNLLLHRMPIRRLEGEAIRDAILSISGELNPQMFGPSVDVHLNEFMEGRGRPKESGPLDSDGRRSIYIAVRRNFLPAMMVAFDMPIPYQPIGNRTVSNVPAQALIMMNDPFVAQQARRWAERLLRIQEPPPRRIERMYVQAYARPPTPTELADALTFIEQQSEAYDLPEYAQSTDPRPWADLAHVLMNVKQFIFID